jgi:HEXXH motif-containing protein
MLTTYRLSRGDLNALATGRGQAAVVQRLRAAELSKHRILLTALMREAARTNTVEYASILVPAYRLLAEVENRHGQVVRSLLAAPQFGAWVSHCVRRLTAAEPVGGQLDTAPLCIDLGQLAVFACTAAFRAGYAFELAVPLRQGSLTFPNFGTAYPGAASAWEWGRVCLDARGARINSPVSTVRIPSAAARPAMTDDAWRGIWRLAADSAGLRFEVTLDDRDPFLNCYGGTRVVVSEAELFSWRRILARAWSVLAGEHRPIAAMIASVMRTLVPLAKPSPTRSASSTAASAFGAIALSLPDDALTMAESLAHEFHHAILGAATDLTPMIGAGAEVLTYAPWRDDARPAGALLQGAYAHYGMARFWRQQRRHKGTAAAQLRASVEFARWRELVTQAAEVLADSGVLTVDGSELVAALRAELRSWPSAEVPDAACEYVGDLNVDHRVRWRLRHLCPDSETIDSLAAAWRRGARPPIALPAIDAAVQRGSMPAVADNIRSYFLMLRYRDPERFHRWMSDGRTSEGSGSSWIDSADAGLALGDYAAAADGYLRRIAAGGDPDAWAGLAIARVHTGPASVARILTERPEVAAALYNRLQDCCQPDPDQIAVWLATLDGTPAPLSAAQ